MTSQANVSAPAATTVAARTAPTSRRSPASAVAANSQPPAPATVASAASALRRARNRGSVRANGPHTSDITHTSRKPASAVAKVAATKDRPSGRVTATVRPWVFSIRTTSACTAVPSAGR